MNPHQKRSLSSLIFTIQTHHHISKEPGVLVYVSLRHIDDVRLEDDGPDLPVALHLMHRRQRLEVPQPVLAPRDAETDHAPVVVEHIGREDLQQDCRCNLLPPTVATEAMLEVALEMKARSTGGGYEVALEMKTRSDGGGYDGSGSGDYGGGGGYGGRGDGGYGGGAEYISMQLDGCIFDGDEIGGDLVVSDSDLLFLHGDGKLEMPFVLTQDTTPLAGSSAGAIVCAVIASGASMQEALKATKILAKDCRLRGTAFRLGAVLRDVLDKFLPDDVHTRSNGRVRVAVTQILWRPRGLLIDQFDSKEDFINALFTSSFIPGYLAPRPATMFRNKLCVDGALTLFMPPTSATQTIRVCAFPASRLGYEGIGISPDCNPENRATPRELFNWALEPAEDRILDKLFEDGYSDAAVWAKQNPVEEIVQDDQPHMENDAVS
ncbi:hypothetical protein RHSIM_Rhsim11G0130300 [Rhododendron simsii]|uniref:Patatin n=1 Tax=Rhododendron simsii TaxID=118357 RepID=A0A834G515_RHOSS|nr:hypothetical protein RHSIM_Rhsim11G0130300 [Rhododendron simsii]